MRAPQWIPPTVLLRTAPLRTALLGGVLAATLVGCGSGTPAGGSPSPTVTPAPSSAATSAPSSTSTASALRTPVEFQRQGGIAGLDDRLVVQRDGAYTIVTRSGTKQGRLTGAELTALAGVLESSGFGRIPASHPAGGVADGFRYRVAYDGHEVRAEDGGLPDALDPVVGALNRVLSTYG